MVYSVIYQREEQDDYVTHAVDWNWNVKNEWVRSEKEGTQWYTLQGLDEPAYDALLEHFGLENCKDELPLEKITKISWKKLGEMRRKLEKERELPRKEIKSHTLGKRKLYVP